MCSISWELLADVQLQMVCLNIICCATRNLRNKHADAHGHLKQEVLDNWRSTCTSTPLVTGSMSVQANLTYRYYCQISNKMPYCEKISRDCS